MLWGIGDHKADDADPGKIVWTPARSVHAAIFLVELPQLLRHTYHGIIAT